MTKKVFFRGSYNDSLHSDYHSVTDLSLKNCMNSCPHYVYRNEYRDELFNGPFPFQTSFELRIFINTAERAS